MKVTRWASAILSRGMHQADERMKLESDAVTGVEAVKTQAWEAYFRTRITSVRAKELSILWKSFKLSALNTLILQTVPTLVTIATFSAYVLLGHELTANKAFTSLSLFAVLRFPLFQLPMVVQQAVRASVAFGRFKEWPQHFLACSAEPCRCMHVAWLDGALACRMFASVGSVHTGPKALSCAKPCAVTSCVPSTRHYV